MWLARCRWRTGLAVLLVLLFPKLVALLLALLVKLCVRAVVALLTHVCKELFFQVMSAATDIEDGLVAYLSQQLGLHPAPPPPFLANGPTGPQQPTVGPVAQQTLPTRPFDLVTVVLLVWNLRRGLPAGGVGENLRDKAKHFGFSFVSFANAFAQTPGYVQALCHPFGI